MNVKPGDVLKRKDSKRTYRYVEFVEGARAYVRKTNGALVRMNLWDWEKKWEIVSHGPE